MRQRLFYPVFLILALAAAAHGGEPADSVGSNRKFGALAARAAGSAAATGISIRAQIRAKAMNAAAIAKPKVIFVESALAPETIQRYARDVTHVDVKVAGRAKAITLYPRSPADLTVQLKTLRTQGHEITEVLMRDPIRLKEATRFRIVSRVALIAAIYQSGKALWEIYRTEEKRKAIERDLEHPASTSLLPAKNAMSPQ